MLVRYRGAAFMANETHEDIVERRSSRTLRGLINILPDKPFYVYIANQTAKPKHLAKFLIVAAASNVLSCIIDAYDDKPCTMKRKVRPRLKANQLTPYMPITTSPQTVDMNK